MGKTTATGKKKVESEDETPVKGKTNPTRPDDGPPAKDIVQVARPVTPKPLTAMEALTDFLAQQSITDDKALSVFRQSQILSLSDLLEVLQDGKERQALEKALADAGSKFAPKKLQAIAVEAVRNEIFFVKNPGAKKSAQLLLEFLKHQNVLGNPNDSDALLCIFLENDVPSLGVLRKLIADGPRQLDTLTAAIAKWDAVAGTAFRKISAAQVARADEPTAEIDDDLKVYLRNKARVPAGADKVLAEFGVTSLDQLKRVKEDPAQSQKLAAKLADTGILNAREAFEKITAAEIQEEISTLDSPVTAQARKRQTELQNAIRDVKELRTQVEGATQANMSSTIAKVGQQYEAVVARVRDACQLDFEHAGEAAVSSQAALQSLLNNTIGHAEAAARVLTEGEQTNLAMPGLMRRLEMLSGALITPGEVVMKRSAELIAMPKSPGDLAKAAEAQESIHLRYTGSKTSSFASSYASQTGLSFSTTTDTTAAGFVGSGLGAISAAASYSDATKASRDQETFRNSTIATCGEIRYIYAPKQTVQFSEHDIQLSTDAGTELASIAKVPLSADKAKRITNFYQRFGSHFFCRYSLGGRYEFNATGENTSEAGKTKLMTAVSKGADWAVSSSASYLGLGGAVKNANAVVGSTTSAHAEADQMRFITESASVRVSIKVLGGAALAPRDVWARSLDFNSNWAVIGRAEPVAIWELLRRLASYSASSSWMAELAPDLEEVWVRNIFRESVRDSNSILYTRIGKDPNIRTCAQLNQLVRDLQAVEPPVKVLMVQQTSASAGHPKVIAQASSTKGLKLIGGGARVDYGDGVGNLLTGSYPEGEGWVATSKEHMKSSPARITAFAIYLVDPEDIWEVKRIEVISDRKSNRPEATAELPADYALTGGGARVDGYGDSGVLLTHCCPVMKDGGYRAWTARGKDHVKSDEAFATAWAIGIRCKNMPPGMNPALPSVIAQAGVGPSRATASSKASADLVVVGGGAAVTYSGRGALLTATYPEAQGNGWSASAKDHIEEDSPNLTTWCIARPGEAVTSVAAR